MNVELWNCRPLNVSFTYEPESAHTSHDGGFVLLHTTVNGQRYEERHPISNSWTWDEVEEKLINRAFEFRTRVEGYYDGIGIYQDW